jgi:hypothetical protein
MDEFNISFFDNIIDFPLSLSKERKFNVWEKFSIVSIAIFV